MNVRALLLDAVTVVTAASAVAVAVHALRRPAGSTRGSTTARPVPAAQWKSLLTSGHRIGPANAGLTIIEFGDFQCPVCRSYESVLDSMRLRHPRDFAVVFHQFPLSYHPLAYALARAAECAAAQGRFTSFHDSAYAEQPKLGLVTVNQIGMRAAVPDTARFDACTADTLPVPNIQRDIAAGRRVGIPGTPAIIVNGVLHGADLGMQDLERLLPRR